MEIKAHEWDYKQTHDGALAACFLISTTVGTDAVRLERLSNEDAPDVFATETTFDALVGCPEPRVLLVQFRGERGTSVTATTAK